VLAAIVVAMRSVSDPASGVAVLAALPVTLIALELGLAGGLAAAAAAAAVLAVSATDGHPTIGAVGVATRALVFLAIAAVAGRFSDRMRQAYAREQRLLDSGLQLGRSLAGARVSEIVARAAARVPGVRGAHVVIAGEAPVDVGDSGARRVEIPIQARGAELGRLEVFPARGPGLEERAALELLALQAGLAADNRRLLARERERAGVEAELRRAEDRLLEQRSSLGQLVSSQEQERREIAHRLHDELAQVLAAVLMGLRLLEGGERVGAVEDLRGQVADVLRELRAVAGSLRPQALDHLGLGAALRALEVDLVLTAEALPASLETSVYRIVEEAAACATGSLHVTIDRDGDDVVLDLRPSPAIATTIRARVEAVDGTLESQPLPDGGSSLRVVLPVTAVSGREGGDDARAVGRGEDLQLAVQQGDALAHPE
jgi:signal transduction histidine kinase